MKLHLRPVLRLVVAAGTTLTALVLSVGLSYAYPSGTYGSGTYGSCVYGSACSISITSTGTVSLNIIPTSGGRCTINSDVATVTTDDSNGYTLTLASNTTSTSLTNGAVTIAATSGTFASPAALTANKWGYRIDSVGSFGAGPTSSASNASITSATFAAIKASNATADTIATTSAAASSGSNTTVWYGACADTSLKSGTYTTQVTYTAVVN